VKNQQDAEENGGISASPLACATAGSYLAATALSSAKQISGHIRQQAGVSLKTGGNINIENAERSLARQQKRDQTNENDNIMSKESGNISNLLIMKGSQAEIMVLTDGRRRIWRREGSSIMAKYLSGRK